MTQRALPILLALFLIATSVQAGWAQGAPGVWRSTSGNTFVIPNSQTNFDIIMKAPDGRHYIAHGWWVAGRIGVQFQYRFDGSPNIINTATFLRNNPNSMQVVSTDGSRNYWIRVR
jgi:hypothetical protein